MEATKVNEWLNDIETIDQETVEQVGAKYPYIQWVHGNAQFKQLKNLAWTGGWFFPAGQVDDAALMAAGWQPFTLSHKGGGETEGYAMRDVTVAMLHTRHAWVVQDGDRAQFYPWNQYDTAKAAGKPRGKTQVLCVLKGLEDLGPVVLTMRGAVGQAFSDSRTGVVAEFNRKAIQPANIIAAKAKIKAKWAFRAFWLTVGPKRNGDGSPAFDTVGTGAESSPVTLPVALGLAEKATENDVRAAYVGRELLEQLNTLRDETADWAAAWDTIGQAEPADANGHDGVDTEAEVAALAGGPGVEELPF